MADLTPQELQRLLTTLDDLCRQAQELQRQIKATMAAQARRDYPSSDRRGVERRSQKRREE